MEFQSITAGTKNPHPNSFGGSQVVVNISGVKANIIYPATEKHIAKFSQQVIHIVQETPELYKTLTLPHIEKEQFTLQVITNIIISIQGLTAHR